MKGIICTVVLKTMEIVPKVSYLKVESEMLALYNVAHVVSDFQVPYQIIRS